MKTSYATTTDFLRKLSLANHGQGASDAELLSLFVTNNDEHAFRTLIQRHGPMVFGVCKRILGHPQEAEDAFQATFIIFARRASSIRDNVGGWLHGVARRAALKARQILLIRQRREKLVSELPDAAEPAPATWDHLRPILDQELSALPEKYRTAIVLCDLEGKTHREAAQQLGWTPSTLSTRLYRGRKQLALRLKQRGLNFTAGTLVTILAAENVVAALPQSLAAATVQGAMACAASESVVAGVLSIKIMNLVKGVEQMMWTESLKACFRSVLVVGMICLAAVSALPSLSFSAQEGQNETVLPAQAASTRQTATEADLNRLWRDLRSKDAGTAARATIGFAVQAKKAVAFLKSKLKPVKIDDASFNKLLKDLGSNNFRRREQATAELSYYGKFVKARLQKAKSKATDEEVRQRLAKLLANIPPEPGEIKPRTNLQELLEKNNGIRVQTTFINGKRQIRINGVPIEQLGAPPEVVPSGPPQDWIRAVRAIAVLEQFGTGETRELLQQMASGEREALPTQAAVAALKRLKGE